MAAIEEIALWAYRNDFIDGANSPTGKVGTPFIIVQPELAASLTKWFRSLGLSYDPVTAETLGSNPGLLDGTGIIGTLNGVMVFTYNHLAVPTGSNDWEFYAGVKEAVAVGLRDPLVRYLTPEENQVDPMPAFRLDQTMEWAAIEVVDDWHRKVVIKAD